MINCGKKNKTRADISCLLVLTTFQYLFVLHLQELLLNLFYCNSRIGIQ